MDLYLLLVIVATLLCSRIFSFVYAKFRVQENKIIIASSSSSSPPSPKSSLPRNPIHDVFPSFHGADVRKSFLSHFLKECRSKGINLFIDNEITRGEFIGPELKKAIQGSKIAIVLLSKRYASSSWCLDELVEIMKCKEEFGQTVMPVFYEVDPTDVKKQAGEFGKVFKETCKGKTNEVTGKWSQTLAEVATLAGYHSKNWDNEAKMVEDVATKVANKLFNSTPPRDFDEFIGMEDHMDKISLVLRRDLDEVRMIGIWGPAGIGKTTIARCLFNQLSDTFQYSVFLMNVKAMYTPPLCSDDHNVKLHLQQNLLSQLLNQKEEDFKISHLGVARERLNDKNVLVVLDDVDRLVQLEAMAKETRWFGNGSRIIITTQDRKILKAHGITHIYKVDFPSDCEAIQMFCMYAFGKKYPEDGFERLVQKVTRLAGNLPLGLRVMGSYFRGMSKQEWENALPELWMCLDGEIESILMFAYDALSHENKDLFLHIACFFYYERTEKVVEHLSKRFPDVRQRLSVLAEKSLISLESGVVIVHDLLVQLGRYIVRKQSIEPGHRQFLVDKRETREVLANDAVGSRSVIGIKFYGDEINVSERAFEGMSNLQFLRFRVGRDGGGDALLLSGGPSYLSRKIRLLDWSYSPMTCLHCIPNPELLVELNMPHSKLEKLWEGTKQLSNLKWVTLSDSENLKDVSSLSTATRLEELDLTRCSSLVKLPSSTGNAIHLKKLDLSECSSLVELPYSILNAIHLEELNLTGCSSLVELPSSIGNATNLQSLSLRSCSSLVELPSSIGNATNLQFLSLSNCSSLVELPSSIGNAIRNLEKLDLSDCSSLVGVPSSIGNATNLQRLDFSRCSSLVELPASVGNLHQLESLILRKCSKLEILPVNINLKSLTDLDLTDCSLMKSFPEISTNIKFMNLTGCSSLVELSSSIGNATNLQFLSLRSCSSLVELPSSIGNATNLKCLDFRRCSSLVELPASIGNLQKLESLILRECCKLEVLPVNMNLKSLTTLDLTDCSLMKSLPEILTNIENMYLTGCSSLVEIPSSIGNATSLQFLSFDRCSSLVELPSSIGNAIRNLEDLDFSDCSSLVGVPSSIGNATNLKRLDFNRCSSLVELPASIGNLHKLDSLILKGCCKLEVLPVNINLKSLRKLDLTDCSLMKCFHEISTNIEYMYLTGTTIKEVPSSIRLWHNLTTLFMSNTKIQEISPWIKRISRLRRLVLNGCKELLSLPQLPTSLSEIDAENCESLERLDCSFFNQNIALNFSNCFKLNKEARDVIIQTSTDYVTMLPGKEMPSYFNYVIFCDERYTVFLLATNQSLVFKNSAIRRSGESVIKLFLQNCNEANDAATPHELSFGFDTDMQQVPEEHSREDDSCKRKRGEVEHSPVLSDHAANESVSPLSPSQARTVMIALKQTETVTQEMTVQPVSNQSGVQNHTTQEESSEEGKRKREHNLSSSATAGVEETQAKDTIVVLPFAKESSLWKELETMEVFQRAPPQSPHFSPLVGVSEVFREGCGVP